MRSTKLPLMLHPLHEYRMNDPWFEPANDNNSRHIRPQYIIMAETANITT